MPKKKPEHLLYTQPQHLDWPWTVAFTEAPPQRWYLMRQVDPALADENANLLPTKVLQLAPHASAEDAEAEARVWVDAIMKHIAYTTSSLRTWGVEPVGVEWRPLRLGSKGTTKCAPASFIVKHRRYTFIVGKHTTPSLMDRGDDIIGLVQRGKVYEFAEWPEPAVDVEADSPQSIMDALISSFRFSEYGEVEDDESRHD